MVPARNSSWIGWSSGSLSIRPPASSPGSASRPLRLDQLVEQLGDPLAEDLHLLLLQRDRGDLVAGARLQEEGALPGLADRAGTKRSGGSKRWTTHGHASTPRRGRRRARRPRRPRRRSAALARRASRLGGTSPARSRRGVHGHHERRGAACSGRPRRRRVDTIRWKASRCMPSASARIALITSPWETASQTASGAVLGLDRRVAVAHRRDGAGLHLRHRLATGERRRGRLRLHRAPELLLGQLLELPPGPVAVVALGAGRARSPTRAGRLGRPSLRRSRGSAPAGWSPRRRAAARRAVRPPRAACSVPVVVEVDARRPPGQHAGGVRRGTSVPRQDHGCHARSVAEPQPWLPVIVDNALYRNGERVDLGQRHARPRRVRAKATGPTTSSGSGCTSPTSEELGGRRPLRPAPARRRGRGPAHQRPKVERYDDSLFIVLKTLWYVDEEDAVETGEISLFVGHKFVVTVRHGAGGGLKEARQAARGPSNVLAHGPSAVVYAVCDAVVDRYEEVAESSRRTSTRSSSRCSRRAPTTPTRIYILKRELAEMRRAVIPLREPMNRFTAAGSGIHERRRRRTSATSPTTSTASPRRSTPWTTCCRPPSTPTWHRSHPAERRHAQDLGRGRHRRGARPWSPASTA